MSLTEAMDLRLSAAQRDLWLAQELGAESQGNNIAELFYIEGKLDEGLFRGAAEHTFHEVEALQVRFLQQNETILQRLDPSSALNCTLIDLRGKSSPQLAILEWISRDLRQHMNLMVSRLYETALFRLSGTNYAWYVRAHHIFMDGYSGMLWARRVAEVYTALVDGKAPSPSP